MRDVRRQRVVGGAGGLGVLFNLVGRTFGLKGILILFALGFIGWQFGLLDPAMLTGGDTRVLETDYEPTAEEQERFQFVSVVLADTERVWESEFDRLGREYSPPELVIFRGQYPSGCGLGDARTGPFYCPADGNIYVDLSFYDALDRTLGAPGDFAQAYVIAHEVGHHVQNLLGVTDRVSSRRGEADFNQYSVRLELQADFLAGVWAKQNREYLDQGDIEEALWAAHQIGDDIIQKRAGAEVAPHAFTHGTAEQRMRWFERGLASGRLEDGDTFAVAYESL